MVNNRRQTGKQNSAAAGMPAQPGQTRANRPLQRRGIGPWRQRRPAAGQPRHRRQQIVPVQNQIAEIIAGLHGGVSQHQHGGRAQIGAMHLGRDGGGGGDAGQKSVDQPRPFLRRARRV